MSAAVPLLLTVLGSATPYPAADNPCSGYLVTHGDTRIWVDAGTGTLGALQRHTPLGSLDAVWISHLHADHCSDLLTAYYGLLYADIELPAPLPLFGPPGIADRLAGFLTNGPRRSPIEAAFDVHELADHHTAEVGDLTLTSRAVSHGGLSAFALRVDAPAGASLVYSGDCRPCVELTELAAECDTLLCEADLDHAPADEPQVHHTPEDAADTAASARARTLVVTHVGRGLGPQNAVSRAAARFAGPVRHADPGATFTIGA
ncbi:MBL fold metallo-hydrolase [Yinghuangia seranimata]|uniref:MBL fold metallo-hydrolase n=1 Tax=Yinghuangia seranimata TaxID=408067 RepID=UPI00248B0E6A|nr:MBL fold metallo-hydrolase [Yinghuangia seranimata]MDI2130632.1 MBL fold metallo-hydrolase [Yinghuangia seranimata]